VCISYEKSQCFEVNIVRALVQADGLPVLVTLNDGPKDLARTGIPLYEAAEP